MIDLDVALELFARLGVAGLFFYMWLRERRDHGETRERFEKCLRGEDVKPDDGNGD